MFRSWILLFALASMVSLGCTREAGTSPGNVAVVDLDKVATDLGLSQHWSAELTAKQQSVNQQLTDYQEQLNAELQRRRGEILTANGSDTATAQEKNIELASYQQELTGKLRQVQEEAKKLLTTERSRIVKGFRTQAEQVCQEVAKNKGFDVVLTKNDSVVLTYGGEADITAEVSKALRARLSNRPTALPSAQSTNH